MNPFNALHNAISDQIGGGKVYDELETSIMDVYSELDYLRDFIINSHEGRVLFSNTKHEEMKTVREFIGYNSTISDKDECLNIVNLCVWFVDEDTMSMAKLVLPSHHFVKKDIPLNYFD